MPPSCNANAVSSVAAHLNHIHVIFKKSHIRIDFRELEKQALEPNLGWKCPICLKWSNLACESCQNKCKNGLRAPVLQVIGSNNKGTLVLLLVVGGGGGGLHILYILHI